MPRSDPVSGAGKMIWIAVCVVGLAVIAIAAYMMFDRPTAAPARGSAGSLQQNAPNAARARP